MYAIMQSHGPVRAEGRVWQLSSCTSSNCLPPHGSGRTVPRSTFLHEDADLARAIHRANTEHIMQGFTLLLIIHAHTDSIAKKQAGRMIWHNAVVTTRHLATTTAVVTCIWCHDHSDIGGQKHQQMGNCMPYKGTKCRQHLHRAGISCLA